MTTSIAVTTSFVGFHCWPDAPPHRAYLAQQHRHKFGVKVRLSVTEHDREVEFHDLLDHVKAALPSDDGTNMSCEHHAKRIGEILMLLYPGRTIEVTVDEDGECEATVSLP